MSTKLRVKIAKHLDGTEEIHVQYRWFLIWRYFKLPHPFIWNYPTCWDLWSVAPRMFADLPSAECFLREKEKEDSKPVIKYISLSELK